MPEVNKSATHQPALHGRPISVVNIGAPDSRERPALNFSGWTIYGYWLNGELNRGKPGLSIWHTPIVKERLVTAEERKAKHEAWKKQVENARISPSEAVCAIEDALDMQIPTL